MKVIFLDIDGVLALKHRERDSYGSLFHDHFVDNLRCIIDATGAKIVISSTWRMSGLEVMKEMWEKRNLPGEVIDITPFGQYAKINGLYTLEKEAFSDKIGVDRGSEIEYWLKSKGFTRINWSMDRQLEYLEKSEVKNYVILDDDSDMLLGQYEHFVKCSNSIEPDALEGYGLTKKASETAIEILNSDIIKLYYTQNEPINL